MKWELRTRTEIYIQIACIENSVTELYHRACLTYANAHSISHWVCSLRTDDARRNTAINLRSPSQRRSTYMYTYYSIHLGTRGGNKGERGRMLDWEKRKRVREKERKRKRERERERERGVATNVATHAQSILHSW